MSSFTLFARALLAYSVHEHEAGHASRIDISMAPGSFTIRDDGRGMGLDRGSYVEDLMSLVTRNPASVQLHGVGLSIVAASTPRLVIESHRGGRLWRQSFAWGISDGPPSDEPADPDKRGTKITMVTAPGERDADAVAIQVHAEVLSSRHPGLNISLQ